MEKLSVEEIYQQHVQSLSPAERLRLIEITAHELVTPLAKSVSSERHDWIAVRGIAPNLLEGEDAQAWVSRTRSEADESRERQWKRQT
jgi:hypothetical protein